MKNVVSLFLLLLVGCSSSETVEEPVVEQLYFPPINSSVWETKTPESLGWNTANLPSLYTFLQDNGTRAFIVLKNGRVVVEKYWNSNLTNTGNFTDSSLWYWASAGKSLTATLVGIAQQEGILNIEAKSSTYLGTGWTSLPLAKENLIKVKHQLTMTTGLDYNIPDLDCTDPSCLVYKADAGAQWFYHNGPYTLLEKVVANASGKTYNTFTDEKIEVKIGMNGMWIPSGYNNVYYSTARDMARFGLLILNKGRWENTAVLSDLSYYNAMVTTSQNLNVSYGYLWWLNGKSPSIFPGTTVALPTWVAPNAPSDMFSAMGKNGQTVDVIPSKNLVVIRMGDAPGNDLVPVVFHDELWQKLMQIIN